VTEEDWLHETDPLMMLGFLWNKAPDRKLWLFVSTCARNAWNLPPGAVEEMENLALDEPWSAAKAVVMLASMTKEGGKPVCPGLRGYEANLFRELFGPLPFRPVTVRPSWKTEEVTSLARHVFEGGDFGRMPALTDALLNAGCDDPDVLDHCQSAGPHVRGCWALDLILGWE
jgi:hypothetical protein